MSKPYCLVELCLTTEMKKVCTLLLVQKQLWIVFSITATSVLFTSDYTFVNSVFAIMQYSC